MLIIIILNLILKYLYISVRNGILPQICKWGQPTIDKGYIEAEKVIKNRNSNEDKYDSQIKYLDKWQYKYPRIKSGIGEKESRKAVKIF
jgi:hypothetical protein